MKNQFQNPNSNLGFTLIETIIAISIIALVITAAAQLTQSSLRLGRITMHEFVANHLAEEGLEIVRNIRDTNWLSNHPWQTGLAPGTYEIQEKRDSGITDFSLTAIQNPALHQPTPEHPSLRTITLSLRTPQNVGQAAAVSEPETLTVKSTVDYLSEGAKKSLSLTTELTDWKQGPL